MDPLVPTKEPKEPITVTPAEIIYHRRVRVLAHAKETGQQQEIDERAQNPIEERVVDRIVERTEIDSAPSVD